MFCRKCGANIGEAQKCPYCGMEQGQNADTNEYNSNSNGSYGQPLYTQPVQQGTKSRLVAGLLQLFVGFLGIGRFYLGFAGLGVLQIIVTLLSCGIAGAIWGFVDGILILNGSVKFDGQGKWLED